MIPKVFPNLNGSGILDDSGWALGLATFGSWFNPGFKETSEISIITPEIFQSDQQTPTDPSLPLLAWES